LKINRATGASEFTGALTALSLTTATINPATLVSPVVSGSLRLPSYTVTGLSTIASPAAGMMVYVTDLTTPTYNGALVGGGAVGRPCTYNGSAWVS